MNRLLTVRRSRRRLRIRVVAACPELRAQLQQLVAAQREARLVAVTVDHQDAIGQASPLKPELIILGVNQTNRHDALTALLQIKHRFPTAIIVAVAADGSSRGQIKWLAAGADLFLTATTMKVDVPTVIQRLRQRPLHDGASIKSPRMFRLTRSKERR